MSSSQETRSSTPKKNTPKNTPKKGAGKGVKRAAKGTKKVSTGDNKTRKSSRKSNSYKSYIFKVLRKIAPKQKDKETFGISKNAMFVVDSMLMGLLRDMIKTSADLTTVSKRKTISSREIRTSALLITENAKDRRNNKNIQSATIGRLDSAIRTYTAAHGKSK